MMLFRVIFSSFPLYPQIYGLLFSSGAPNSVTPVLCRM